MSTRKRRNTGNNTPTGASKRGKFLVPGIIRTPDGAGGYYAPGETPPILPADQPGASISLWHNDKGIKITVQTQRSSYPLMLQEASRSQVT
jgi:hypothetical protein